MVGGPPDREWCESLVVEAQANWHRMNASASVYGKGLPISHVNDFPPEREMDLMQRPVASGTTLTNTTPTTVCEGDGKSSGGPAVYREKELGVTVTTSRCSFYA